MNKDYYDFLLKKTRLEAIKECVNRVARLSTQELTERSRKAWEYARSNHTREKFAQVYRIAVEEIIRVHGCN